MIAEVSYSTCVRSTDTRHFIALSGWHPASDENAFLFRSKPYNVPAVFQIWEPATCRTSISHRRQAIW